MNRKHYPTTMLCLILLLYPALTYNQTDTIAPKVYCALPQWNILYSGISNPIIIEPWEFNGLEISIVVDNGEVSGANGRYSIQPKFTGVLNLDVMLNERSIKHIAYRVFHPGPLGTRILLVNFEYIPLVSKSISRNQLNKFKEIVIVMENSPILLNARVTSFSFLVTTSGKQVEFETTGSEFSVEQLQCIKNADPGSALIITNIQIVIDGHHRRLPDIIFTSID